MKTAGRARAGWRAGLAGIVAATAFLALGLVVGCGDATDVESPPALQLVEGPDAQPVTGYTADKGAGETVSVASVPGGGVLPDIGQKIVKTGSLELKVDRGAYAQVRDRVRELAASCGGYLQGESSAADSAGLVRGTITVRVPAEQFDAVFGAIMDFGRAGKTNVKTSDMTQEYVDLESRLRHLGAEEAFYLALIDKAATVSDMISISDRLSDIQQQKETALGRQRYLDDQVAYATITTAVSESAGPATHGFWSSVSSAFRSFGQAGKYLGLGILYALPYLLVAGVAGFVFWKLRKKNQAA